MTEELGGSCGQGIGKGKKGGLNGNDGKRPSDQHEVNVCKGKQFTVLFAGFEKSIKKQNN